MLYIVTNNHEYHTLQVGLKQVVAAYGSAPGYGWHPETEDPDYLRIQRPKIDFVALARAFGGQEGEIVTSPGDVEAAVRRGVEHVLTTRRSFILDMRTGQNTPRRRSPRRLRRPPAQTRPSPPRAMRATPRSPRSTSRTAARPRATH